MWLDTLLELFGAFADEAAAACDTPMHTLDYVVGITACVMFTTTMVVGMWRILFTNDTPSQTPPAQPTPTPTQA